MSYPPSWGSQGFGQSSNTGFPIWIFIVGLTALFGVAMLRTGGCAGSWQDTATRQAKDFAAELGYPKDTRVSCAKYDTDGDDYVSCTLSVLQDNGPELIPVDCSPLWGACRLTVIRVPERSWR